MKKTVAVLFALAAVALAPIAQAEPAQKLVVALKPDKNPEQMLNERKALAAFLGEKLGREVEVIVPLSSAVILEGFANGTIDLGYLSAADVVNGDDAPKILLAGEINGQTSYKSYWVALKDKPYGKVEELRGKPVAFSSKTSTSGFIIPLLDLHQKGLVDESGDPEKFFGKGNVWYGSGYVSAVERVLAGEAEAAAISYYVLDKEKHLTPEQRAQLKKVAEQGPVPTHVIAVRQSLPEAEQTKLAEVLKGMDGGEAGELRDKVFTSKLVEVDPEQHLAPLREAMKLIKK